MRKDSDSLKERLYPKTYDAGTAQTFDLNFRPFPNGKKKKNLSFLEANYELISQKLFICWQIL